MNLYASGADLRLGSKSVSAEVTVIKEQGEPLLGRESAIELSVLKMQVPLNCEVRVDHSELTTIFKDLSTGIGKLKDFQLKLHVDEQVQPVAQALQRSTFGLKEKIENFFFRHFYIHW